jgi:hypothetical protein
LSATTQMKLLADVSSVELLVNVASISFNLFVRSTNKHVCERALSMEKRTRNWYCSLMVEPNNTIPCFFVLLLPPRPFLLATSWPLQIIGGLLNLSVPARSDENERKKNKKSELQKRAAQTAQT